MKKLIALLPALIACLIFVGTLTLSCKPSEPAKDGATHVADGVPREAALAFAGAYSAFAALDATEAERLAAITKTGDPEKAKAAQPLAHARNSQLHRLRDLLELTRKWLAGKAQGGEQALRDAVALVRLVVSEMRAQGLAVPAAADAGLAGIGALL